MWDTSSDRSSAWELLPQNAIIENCDTIPVNLFVGEETAQVKYCFLLGILINSQQKKYLQ